MAPDKHKEEKTKETKSKTKETQIKYAGSCEVRKRTRGPSGRTKPSKDFVRNISARQKLLSEDRDTYYTVDENIDSYVDTTTNSSVFIEEKESARISNVSSTEKPILPPKVNNKATNRISNTPINKNEQQQIVAQSDISASAPQLIDKENDNNLPIPMDTSNEQPTLNNQTKLPPKVPSKVKLNFTAKSKTIDNTPSSNNDENQIKVDTDPNICIESTNIDTNSLSNSSCKKSNSMETANEVISKNNNGLPPTVNDADRTNSLVLEKTTNLYNYDMNQSNKDELEMNTTENDTKESTNLLVEDGQLKQKDSEDSTNKDMTAQSAISTNKDIEIEIGDKKMDDKDEIEVEGDGKTERNPSINDQTTIISSVDDPRITVDSSTNDLIVSGVSSVNDLIVNRNSSVSDIIKNGNPPVNDIIKSGDSSVNDIIKSGDSSVNDIINNGNPSANDIIVNENPSANDTIVSGNASVNDAILTVNPSVNDTAMSSSLTEDTKKSENSSNTDPPSNNKDTPTDANDKNKKRTKFAKKGRNTTTTTTSTCDGNETIDSNSRCASTSKNEEKKRKAAQKEEEKQRKAALKEEEKKRKLEQKEEEKKRKQQLKEEKKNKTSTSSFDKKPKKQSSIQPDTKSTTSTNNNSPIGNTTNIINIETIDGHNTPSSSTPDKLSNLD